MAKHHRKKVLKPVITPVISTLSRLR